MIRYIIRRILWAALVLLIVVFFTYVIFFLLPAGDPALRFAGRTPTPAILASVRHQFGLDKPWYVQYGTFTRTSSSATNTAGPVSVCRSPHGRH